MVTGGIVIRREGGAGLRGSTESRSEGLGGRVEERKLGFGKIGFHGIRQRKDAEKNQRGERVSARIDCARRPDENGGRGC